MFGTPFGQCSDSPFGSQSGSSMFGGGTSTAVFGQALSPTLLPAFGSPTPGFGVSSAPSVFGVLGQKHTFGAFGSTPSQATTFGGTSRQTQEAFGSNLFGSTTPFGPSSQPPFGSSNQPAFGTTSNLPSGSTTTTAFGSTTTPLFGSTRTGFGVPSAPTIGSPASSAFGSQSTSSFGSSYTTVSSPTSTPAFVSAPTLSVGSSSSFSIGVGAGPSDQSTSISGSRPFGMSSSSFGSQGFSFGARTTYGSPDFGQSTFGGSRVAAFVPTHETDSSGATLITQKLQSISAMHVYKDKSHEELRLEDYQLVNKGGPNPSGQQANPFGSTGPCVQPQTNLLPSSTTFIPFSPNPTTTHLVGVSITPWVGVNTSPSISVGTAASASNSSINSSLPFGHTQSMGSQFPTPSIGKTTYPFGQSTRNLFGTSSTEYGVTPFRSTTRSLPPTSTPFQQHMTNPFNKSLIGSEQPSKVPPLGQPSKVAPLGQPPTNPFSTSSMGVEVTPFNSTKPSLLPISGPFGQQTTNPFSTSSTGFWQPTTSTHLGQPVTSPFGQPSTLSPLGQPPTNPISTSMGVGVTLFNTTKPLFPPANTPFGQQTIFPFNTSSIGTREPITNTPFGQPVINPFGQPATSIPLHITTPTFPPTGTQPSTTISTLPVGNNQPTGLHFSIPSIGQTPSPFGQPTKNLFVTSSNRFGSTPLSIIMPSLPPAATSTFIDKTISSFPTAFQLPVMPQTPPAISFIQVGHTKPGTSSGLDSFVDQGMIKQSVSNQSNMVEQPAIITNPFGTLPAMPRVSIGRVGSALSVQYGISSMPVAEKASPVRMSSLFTPRHLSQRRIKFPARHYYPKVDGQRVPFFVDDKVALTTHKPDVYVVPRENLRSLIICPIESWPSRATKETQPILKDTHPDNGNDITDENGHNTEHKSLPMSPNSQEVNGDHVDQAQNGKDPSYITVSERRSGKEAIEFEVGADIEMLMPKLHHADYYTEPRIQELAAKESVEPGFSRHVKDFAVGRQGYGRVKFYGETDVRKLDLETLVQFNLREVNIYMDESKKPPVGEGLNKPAEITLLNIKCMDKKTGQQFTEGPKIEKYKDMLMKKTAEQGAEFISYDPIQGEWKFKVKHFSRYGFEDSTD